MHVIVITLPLSSSSLFSLFFQVYVSDLAEGFGLAAQEPWIQFATVRENILFGLPFDSDKYNEVINACALKEVSGR